MKNADAVKKLSPKSVLDDVPETLPALSRAKTIKDIIAARGFDWPDLEAVFAKIQEEVGELQDEINTGAAHSRIADELGDVLYTIVDLARWLEVDPEEALQMTCNKFSARIRGMEHLARDRGKNIGDCSIDEQFELYKKAKAQEKQKKAG